jgi:hypothetical protein
MKGTFALLALAVIGSAVAQPFAPGQGVGPLGTFRTTDAGGPYNITLLSTQANEVAAGGAARGSFTDKDIVDFLVNVECLEGQFDTWGAFGRGFLGDLAKGGPTPIGAQKANLSATNLPYMEEVALNEQGHALFTRQAGGANPCPTIDFTGGFNQFFARAYGLNGTVEQTYGTAFNPFLNDQNFFLSVLTLEELGATGNKGLAGIISNPVIANGVAGLATSATAQATIQRFVLWTLRDAIIQPFGETVTQAFARVSALRDELDGTGTQIDQGLVNTDPRFIAVPAGYINLIPTDVRGLTLNRSPQQIINIVTIGNGVKGGFFPNGLLGAINSSAGYTNTGNGFANFPSGLVTQATTEAVGTVDPPINGSTPLTVPGMYALTQAITDQRENSSYTSRGYFPAPAVDFNQMNATVAVAKSSAAGSSQGIATAGK